MAYIFLGPTRVHIPNGTSLDSSVLHGSRSSPTDRQTGRQSDRPRYNVGTSGPRPVLRIAMRPLSIWYPRRAPLKIDRHDDIALSRRRFFLYISLRVARKKRPKLSTGIMQQSRWNESAEKHVCNEQTSSNMSTNFYLKRFHISRDTSEIVLHVIKQCLQAVRHLCCWL